MNNTDNLILHVKNCLKNTELLSSKLTNEILEMYGMSGYKTRHLYNNLCNNSDIKLLEIGTFKGSTTCSLIYKNNILGFCVDDFSQFTNGEDNVKNIFLENFNKFKGSNNIKFIAKDCWLLNNKDFLNTKFNLYIFDGHHSKKCHFKAINLFLDYMEDIFIYIVDDWNYMDVRVGTKAAIKLNNLKILYKKEIFTTENNKHPKWDRFPFAGKKSEFHNGLVIYVLKK
jgi:hypothetical protein